MTAKDNTFTKEGRYHKECVKYESAWLDNIGEDMKVYKMTEHVAQNRSVRHMKTKAGPLLHEGL